MKSTQEQKARNSAGSKKELELKIAQEAKNLIKSIDDFELNDEQLEVASGGIYIIPIFNGGIVGGEDGGGCTRP